MSEFFSHAFFDMHPSIQQLAYNALGVDDVVVIQIVSCHNNCNAV